MKQVKTNKILTGMMKDMKHFSFWFVGSMQDLYDA
jgi:hypothetical protein